MGRNMSEKVFTKNVIDLARKLGWRAAHFWDSRRQVRPGVFVGDRDAAGWPDLVLAKQHGGTGPTTLIFAELKSEGGVMTQAQKDWYNILDLVQGRVYVVIWKPKAMQAIADFLMRAA